MKIRPVAKGFAFSSAKRIACVSIAASVLASPLASYAQTSAEVPVSAVSESDVLNILMPSQSTSNEPELLAAPNAESTDVSSTPVAPESKPETKAASDAAVKVEAKTETKTEVNTQAKSYEKTEAKTEESKEKSLGRMAKLRKMAARVRVGREKKAIASSEVASSTEDKKVDSDKTATSANESAVGTDANKASSETATSGGWNDSAATKSAEATTATPAANVESSKAEVSSTESTQTEAANTEASATTKVETTSDAAKADTTAAAAADGSAPMANESNLAAEENTGEKNDGAPIAFGLPGTINDLEKASKLSPDGIMVVDNDEAIEQNDHLEYEDMPLDDGKTKIKIGARFPVVISSAINSKTAKKGDRIEARLKYDLKIGDKLVAKKGSIVRGHVNYSLKARTIMHSLISPERWYRNSGCIGIEFDEIVSENGEHIPCAAAPARAARVIKNKAEGRELGINHNGQVTGPWAQQLRYKAVRVGLNFAMAPAGVFSFGAMPVALGLIGAANPNFAFSKPVGLNVRHRRLKGFAWGFLSGVPGSWIIEDTTVKGQEAVIKPGDEFYAAFKQEFDGEPESDASILAGGSAKVKGQVIKEPTSKKK